MAWVDVNFRTESGVSGDTTSGASSGNGSQPVVIDDFAKWALIGVVAIVGVILIVAAAKK